MRKSVSLLLLVLLSAVLSLPLALNRSLQVASDGLVHSGIAYAIQRDGLPPGNPFLAGEKLPYYWFYDALVAGASALLRREPGMIMALLNPLVLVVFLLAVRAAAGRMSGDPGAGAPGFLAAVWAALGLNGWGSVLLFPLLRAGISSLRPVLVGGVWAYLPRIVPSRWEGTMGFMATKFLVANSFAPSIASLALAVLFLFELFRRRCLKTWLAFSLTLLLTAYLNLVAGGALMAVCLVFFASRLVRPLDRDGIGRRFALWGLLSLALAAAALLPYLLSLGRAADTLERVVRFQIPDRTQLRILAVILLPLWFAAGIGWVAGGIGRTPAARFVSCALVVLSAAFLFARFSRHNEFKLPFLLAIFLALSVGDSSRRLPRWGGVAVWVMAASVLPTTLLGLVAFALAPPQFSVSPPLAAAYGWMRDNLPPDAVVVASGSMDEVPHLVRRDAYLACRPFLRSIPASRGLIRRRKALLARAETEGIGEILREVADEVRRPVYFVTEGGGEDRGDGPIRAYSSGGIAVWSLPVAADSLRRR